MLIHRMKRTEAYSITGVNSGGVKGNLETFMQVMTKVVISSLNLK